MPLTTRLTERFGLTHPVVLAPMAFAAGGRLAAAVSAAGGLGLVGGAYGNSEWVDAQLDAAGDADVGCGFITWSLERSPDLLDHVLERRPRAILLSFGDPRPLARRVLDAGVPLLCQVQSRRDAELALEAGADVIVAQGGEAGGHGERRGTFTLVPEIADLLATRSPGTLLCAAGGIADGRGIAAALVLGADGVLVGSRLWATVEANVSERMHAAALAATGDGTIRTSVMDIARRLDWPERFTARVLRNRFTDAWHGHESELREAGADAAREWSEGWADGDPDRSNTFVGEAVGLIRTIEPAGAVIERMSAEASTLLGRLPPVTGRDSEQTHDIFDVATIAASLPPAAETMLVDTRLTDEADASSRIFRVYRETPPHYHATCDEYLYMLSGRVVFVIDGGPPQEIKAGQLLFLKRNTVHAMPEILEEPVIVMAVDTPRRAPTDIVFVNPADGTPASFISDRDRS